MRLPDLFVPVRVADDPEVRTGHDRRRYAVLGSLAMGVVMLKAAFAAPENSPAFYLCGFAAAAVWLAGGVLGGPVRAGWQRGESGHRRPIVGPFLAGGVAFAMFAVAVFAARHLPLLSGAVDVIRGKADVAPIVLVVPLAVVSAVAEEVFFRGAVVDALPARHAAAGATVIYVAVTTVTGNAAMVVAAAVMGPLFMLERSSTRGVLAPAITHVTWSTLMVFALTR
jgi:CAAX protease family protein